MKTLLEISMVKVENNDTLCNYSILQCWSLYCQMTSYIENVQQTYIIVFVNTDLQQK